MQFLHSAFELVQFLQQLVTSEMRISDTAGDTKLNFSKVEESDSMANKEDDLAFHLVKDANKKALNNL